MALAIAPPMNEPPASLSPSASALPSRAPSSGATPEPSIFLIALYIVMWTTLTCGLIMVLVVAMLNS